MSLHRGMDGSDPLRSEPVTRLAGAHEQRTRSLRMAVGTLACPHCDAPVALAGPASPAHRLACPYCDHTAALRDFLSLKAPARPARVDVRVVARTRPVVH